MKPRERSQSRHVKTAHEKILYGSVLNFNHFGSPLQLTHLPLKIMLCSVLSLNPWVNPAKSHFGANPSQFRGTKFGDKCLKGLLNLPAYSQKSFVLLLQGSSKEVPVTCASKVLETPS